MSMIIDGISASEHLDSSGEVLQVSGHDISDLIEGKGVLNWEHNNDSPEDIIGAIIYAKKIMKKSDCEDERQKMFWDSCKVPFVYIKAELFDDENHPGAICAAALIRYYHRRGMKVLAGFSVEGATLDKDQNLLKRSVGRRVALTLRPCNKSAISDVLSDPKNDEIKKFMQLDKPIVGKAYEVPDIIFSDISKSQVKTKQGHTIHLGNGYSLKMTKNYSWPGVEWRKDSFHHWEIHYKGKQVGQLHAWTDPDKNFGTRYIDGVELDQKHRGRGVGKAAYSALANHYGTIESAYSETSKDARRVWNSLGAKKLPSKTDKGTLRMQLTAGVNKSEHQDKLEGGRADKKKPSQFNAKDLEEGIAHETEHTKDRSIAQEIAMDHLTEDPLYYKKLKTIEKTDMNTQDWAQGVLDAHRKNGGSTFDPKTGTSIGGDNYVVSPYLERSHVIEGDLHPSHIHAFVAANKDLLSTPDHHLGTWHDPESKKHFLDVVITTPDKQHAIGLAQKHNQKAIFHLGTGTTIGTGGSGMLKSEDPLAELRFAVSNLKKTLTAGGANAAPSTLTGGDALAVEHVVSKKKKGLKPESEKKLKSIIAAWDGKTSLAATIKAALPEVSENYIDHFANLAEEYTLKKAVNHIEHCDNHNASVAQDNLITGINVFAHEGQDRFYATNGDGKPVLVVCSEEDAAKRATKFYEFVSTLFPKYSALVPLTNYLKHTALAGQCAYVQLLPEDHDRNTIVNPDYYADFRRDSWILHGFAVIDLISGAYQDRTELRTLCGEPPLFMGNTSAFYYDNFGSKPFYLKLIGNELLHLEAVQLLESIDPVELAVYARYSLQLNPGEIKTMVDIVERLKAEYHGKTITQLFNIITDGIKNEA